MLEKSWVRGRTPGNGTFYIISGFSNFNGGVRFYDVFEDHIKAGGECIVFLGGSTSQRLSSQQVVEKLLEVGCKVYLINRKRLLHAKCYGHSYNNSQSLIVTSGNFTGPGMSQNIEASLMIEDEEITKTGFQWNNVIANFFKQKWDIYEPDLADRTLPAWKLLYDEIGGAIKIEDEQEVTLLVTLSHADTARIQANPGEKAGLGSQYFWLSKDSYDFFPALTIRNKLGIKATYSTLVNMNYVDLGIVDDKCRVTFEAENNLDFRLGTGKLRYTKIAEEGDLAAITRVGENDYELRIIKKETDDFSNLEPHAINFIGHQGKKFGYLSNSEFMKALK
ncbi:MULTISPECIES: phospholipase D-like domain-containing protein [Flavobacteriaceae]|uniref:phospholipase D-like domain-containing protein n=1 Tax=Flavobacteriaceae TaxID=49546 RepID=UPI00234BB816|nr:phospholipase D-like domain-containing protein [Muricauda sp. SP22]MDC6361655.1 phospholipase D-like domain-containing protein [Muricauda sp. SP22]